MAAPTDPVDLTSVNSEFEAATIVEALRAQGIPAQQLGGGIAGFRAEVPSLVRVIVLNRDLEKARLALRAIQAESIDIDWEEVDVGSPEEPARESRPDGSGYRCARCGYAVDHLREDQACPECGLSVRPAEPVALAVSSAASRRKRRRVRALMLQLTLLIAALLAAWALRLPPILWLALGVTAIVFIFWIAFEVVRGSD